MANTIVTALIICIALYVMCWVTKKTNRTWWFNTLIRRINGIQTIRSGGDVMYIDIGTNLLMDENTVKAKELRFLNKLLSFLLMLVITLACLLMVYVQSGLSKEII